jgi:DNA-binding MarR family transcriptional regulator
MQMDPEQSSHKESPFVYLTHIFGDLGQIYSKLMGMSMSRIEVIHALMHAGEISQSALQQQISIEGSLLTRYAKQMEAAGLITRRVDPKDNRFTLVKLAPAGFELLAKMDKVSDEFETRLLNGLSEEDLANFVRILQHIQGNMPKVAELLGSEEARNSLGD